MSHYLITRLTTRTGRRATAPVVIAATMLLAAACSSSGSGANASGSAPAATGSGGSTSADSCVSQASALVSQHLAAKSQDWYPTSSAKGSLAKGKNFWVIPLTSQIPTLADYANGFKNAGEALGAHVTVFDGKATPTVAAQGVNSAIAAHADAIVTALIDPRSIASAVASAKQAKVPMIGADSGPANVLFQDGMSAGVAQVQANLGSWQVDAALKATGCKLHAVMITTNGNIASDATYGGFKAELSKLCPSACSYNDVDVQAQDIATKTQTLVQNALRLHSNTNMVMMVADVYEPYAAKALSTLGSKIPVTTTSSMGDLAGTGANSPVIADIVYAPGLVHGWFYMTGLLGVLNGQKNVEVDLPLGLVDTSNRDSGDPSSYAGTSPYGDYQAQFKKIWGVTG